MQPNLRAETSKLLLPSLRSCMVSPRRGIHPPQGHCTPKHSFPNLVPLAYFDEVLARFSEVHFSAGKAALFECLTARLRPCPSGPLSLASVRLSTASKYRILVSTHSFLKPGTTGQHVLQQGVVIKHVDCPRIFA
jgi:hypothetical protein